ncbi:MAG: hypothetical protein NZT92_01785 [Abditibacteriales bacterium]|nr:hypothetical protein [Abditibacteriales bacterium]MDW8364433.1 hypothetical protein [Abditibacteriales bacterium]
MAERLLLHPPLQVREASVPLDNDGDGWENGDAVNRRDDDGDGAAVP